MKNSPPPLSEKKYCGRFAVRVPSMVHQKLAFEAAERGVSMNHLVSAKLAM
jgi:predicted HicB family RNase H-like nuclease